MIDGASSESIGYQRRGQVTVGGLQQPAGLHIRLTAMVKEWDSLVALVGVSCCVLRLPVQPQ